MTKLVHPRILVIGTGDTKADELRFIGDCIALAGGEAIMMDVSVLGDPPYAPRHDKHVVAQAAETTIEKIAESGDENSAMSLMALGAKRLARRLFDSGDFDGMLAIGGTMGTDLALDVAQALPIGVPKFVISTIAYSHLVPPDRIAADLMMILWAGGLYGLNSTCKAVLSQACGAVVGAARGAIKPRSDRPVVAMTSLGKSCLSYMVELKPALEQRGYEVVVFHTTGMGGRAMESIAAKKGFAAILDLSLQEVANQLTGSVVNSGADRLENAGKAGIPQIVAPGAIDMVDFPAWLPTPKELLERPYHAHNRLLASATSRPERYQADASSDGQFAGTSKGWSNTEASVPARAVLASNTANPLVFIDEIDKAASNHHGSLFTSLLGFLDVETARSYPDQSTGCEFDLSMVSYCCTANDASVLPDMLRDRFRIIRIPAPRLVDLPLLAASIMDDMARENAERVGDDPLAPDELLVIARAWEKAGFSMRKLQKIVAATLEARDQFATRH